MSKKLDSFNGAVLFVDLLGFGALTKQLLPLKNKDYQPWLSNAKYEKNPQFLAAMILVKFREILKVVSNEVSDVTVSQLSDCFFVWSSDIESVVKFSLKFMHRAINNGILCRGGMAYGQIIITEKNHDFGKLILGSAVTQAVELEKPAKGARILTHTDLVHQLFEQNSEFAMKVQDLFKPFTNPLDFTIYDEFKWYLIDSLDNLPEYGLGQLSENEKFKATKGRLKLANRVLYHPKFGWNASSIPGYIQLQATANFLSENYLLDVFHCFENKPLSSIRSIKSCSNLDRIVNNDPCYKISPDPRLKRITMIV